MAGTQATPLTGLRRKIQDVSRGVVLDPTITIGTAYQVIKPDVIQAVSSVKEPRIAIGTTQTITPLAVT